MLSNNPYQINPRLWSEIQKLRLLDDLLMQTALDNFIPGVELILRIILQKPDLTVTELTVQKVLPNLAARDLRIDVLARDSTGKQYNIEVQRSDSGAKPKRPRFHSALMDVQFLKKGMKTDDLPETYVIFITENDVLGQGLPVYHIERVVMETGAVFGDLAHIVYANGAYEGDDEMGRLMADFRASDPDEMHFPLLADHVREIKSNQKGVMEMSRVLEMMYSEGRNEGHVELLFQMMRRYGWPIEQAMDFVGLPKENKAVYEPLIRELQAQSVS